MINNRKELKLFTRLQNLSKESNVVIKWIDRMHKIINRVAKVKWELFDTISVCSWLNMLAKRFRKKFCLFEKVFSVDTHFCLLQELYRRQFIEKSKLLFLSWQFRQGKCFWSIHRIWNTVTLRSVNFFDLEISHSDHSNFIATRSSCSRVSIRVKIDRMKDHVVSLTDALPFTWYFNSNQCNVCSKVTWVIQVE